MANWQFVIKDVNTGSPVPNAFVNITVNTTPADAYSGQTSGPGYNIQAYSDSYGKVTANIQYTCRQDLTGTISANGYADLPFQNDSGVITGDVWFNLNLSPSGPLGSGAPPGQGLGAGLLSGQGASQVSSDFAQAYATTIGAAGPWVTAAIIGIAIIMVVLLVLLVWAKGGGL